MKKHLLIISVIILIFKLINYSFRMTIKAIYLIFASLFSFVQIK